MARQTPGIVLPTLTDVPTSYTHTNGGDASINLARSLVQLGLGTPEIWKRNSANPSTFSRDAIDQWLNEIGAHQLRNYVCVEMAIVDEIDHARASEKNHLIILLETQDGCGAFFIGSALQAMEQHIKGLGRAFYIVLTLTMNSWLDVYDLRNTEYFHERWKESIEMDLEDDSAEAFEAYCKENEINFPDLHASTPAFIRDVVLHKEARRLGHSIKLLQQNCEGKYGEMIRPLLIMAGIRKHQRNDRNRDIFDTWDDGPLPSWLVAFERHDPITQAFDEESASMHESTHAPTWLETFDPANVKEVERVLSYVRDFVTVNLQIVEIQKCIEKWSKSNATTRGSKFHDELRAA